MSHVILRKFIPGPSPLLSLHHSGLFILSQVITMNQPLTVCASAFYLSSCLKKVLIIVISNTAPSTTNGITDYFISLLYTEYQFSMFTSNPTKPHPLSWKWNHTRISWDLTKWLMALATLGKFIAFCLY